MFLRLLLLAVLSVVSLPALAVQKVNLDYRVKFLPDSDQAEVSLTLGRGEVVTSLLFNLGDLGLYSDFQADGQWLQHSAAQGEWRPAAGKSSLKYRVRISQERTPGRYDALMTQDWELMRGFERL